ncbi:MAG: hypothetical protein Q7R51_01270 [bacterium]|nr:hypothetical protein [bacterium]
MSERLKSISRKLIGPALRTASTFLIADAVARGGIGIQPTHAEGIALPQTITPVQVEPFDLEAGKIYNLPAFSVITTTEQAFVNGGEIKHKDELPSALIKDKRGNGLVVELKKRAVVSLPNGGHVQQGLAPNIIDTVFKAEVEDMKRRGCADGLGCAFVDTKVIQENPIMNTINSIAGYVGIGAALGALALFVTEHNIKNLKNVKRYVTSTIPHTINSKLEQRKREKAARERLKNLPPSNPSA